MIRLFPSRSFLRKTAKTAALLLASLLTFFGLDDPAFEPARGQRRRKTGGRTLRSGSDRYYGPRLERSRPPVHASLAHLVTRFPNFERLDRRPLFA